MNKKDGYETIGYAEFTDIEQFLVWAKENGKRWVNDNWSKEKNHYCSNNWDPEKHIGFCYLQGIVPGLNDALEVYDSFFRLERLKKNEEYLRFLGQKFFLIYHETRFSIIKDGTDIYLVPNEYLKIEKLKDYNAVSVRELQGIAGDIPGIVPADGKNLSVNHVKTNMQKIEEQMEENRNDLKALEKEKEAELQKLKEELEKKYQNSMQEIKRKKQELKEKQEELEKQLFLLDTEIYSIRCYMGEVVKFTRLLSGERSPIETPLVAYQKIRYLDEEMGKYLSMYDFDGSDIQYFEQALVYREDLRDLLVPGPKAIVFLRISRNNVRYGDNENVANSLKAYKTLHGKQIGILIRDGANLWIGWTDEERIHLSTEDVYYKNKTEITTEEDATQIHCDTKEERAGRIFIFHILQGLLDDGKILRLPEKIQMLSPSPYLVFSYADGWIEDNRFGSFADIVDRTNNQTLMKGDRVLTTMYITRDDARSINGRQYQSWNNNRGRGDRNRTHDASLTNRTIYPVNQIDVEEWYEIRCKKYRCDVENVMDKTEGNCIYSHPVFTRTEEFMEDTSHDIVVKNGKLDEFYDVKGYTMEELYQFILEIDYCNFKENRMNFVSFHHAEEKRSGYYEVPQEIVKKKTRKSYYLSAEKEDSNGSKANMQIFSDEYLNLTYLNTVWVQYAIQNKKIGGWHVGGLKMDYANSISYLNVALSYLKEREKEEAELLKPYMELYPDWQVDLSEWKMEKQYHRLTDRRAKAFAKEMRERKKIHEEKN